MTFLRSSLDSLPPFINPTNQLSNLAPPHQKDCGESRCLLHSSNAKNPRSGIIRKSATELAKHCEAHHTVTNSVQNQPWEQQHRPLLSLCAQNVTRLKPRHCHHTIKRDASNYSKLSRFFLQRCPSLCHNHIPTYLSIATTYKTPRLQ